MAAFCRQSGDPETHLAGWLATGAPTGVAEPILASGVFPVVALQFDATMELKKHYAKVVPPTQLQVGGRACRAFREGNQTSRKRAVHSHLSELASLDEQVRQRNCSKGCRAYKTAAGRNREATNHRGHAQVNGELVCEAERENCSTQAYGRDWRSSHSHVICDGLPWGDGRPACHGLERRLSHDRSARVGDGAPLFLGHEQLLRCLQDWFSEVAERL